MESKTIDDIARKCYHKVIANRQKDLVSTQNSKDYLKDGYRDCYTCSDRFAYTCDYYTPYDG